MTLSDGSQGPQGEQGEQGAAGADGEGCSATDNGDGSYTIECPDGTTLTLSDGTPGQDGTDGLNTLIESVAVAPGSDCANGVEIFAGVDLDGDGVLDAEEVTSSELVCNGEDGSGCSVTDNGDGTATMVCPDGTEVVMVVPFCGDGVLVPAFEACDDGNESNADGCTNDCALNVCGDGFVHAGVEACDDANQDDTDACLNSCEAARCGDGITQVGVESCDDGNTDNTDACLNSCQVAGCGDGFVQADVESCDDGNTVLEVIIAYGLTSCEVCDAECATVAGVTSFCGDTLVNGAETCDDGNDVDTDACRNQCIDARCGDGVVWAGTEACDDGDSDNTDACLNTCIVASCGDGFVQSGIETCDDGNNVDGDYCSADCSTITAVCGDGEVGPGESCDDGNQAETDFVSTIVPMPHAAMGSLTAMKSAMTVILASELVPVIRTALRCATVADFLNLVIALPGGDF